MPSRLMGEDEEGTLAALTCASSLSYLARFFGEKVSYRCFDGVASDLMARRDAMESLSLAFEGRECQL